MAGVADLILRGSSIGNSDNIGLLRVRVLSVDIAGEKAEENVVIETASNSEFDIISDLEQIDCS